MRLEQIFGLKKKKIHKHKSFIKNSNNNNLKKKKKKKKLDSGMLTKRGLYIGATQ
jgi:hypothetical protein